MSFSLPRFASLIIFAALGAALGVALAAATAQEPPLNNANIPAGEAPTDPPDPNVPKGVEVLARGPVHEAFVTATTEPKPTQYVPKKPPVNIEEMPPEDKPEGDAVWIGGYWAWDDDRDDHLWVSGCWRVRPAGKEWVPGYWREQSNQWQWVPGFWTTVQDSQQPEVTYYPEPPAPPQLAPPGNPPEPDMFYVPGHWMWVGNHYVWRAGYFTRARADQVYVASHYRWTPHGYVFVAGYWDYAVARRGVLYAPVVVDTVVVGPRFVYTPYYAVTDTIVVDAFFVRPGFCHYYFGDYYGPRYASIGFVCGYHYSRVHYCPIVTYNRWYYRDTPGWFDLHVSISLGRSAGRVACPPRTLVQQVNVVNVRNVRNVTVNKTVVNNTTVNNKVAATEALAPAKKVMASKGVKHVAMDAQARKREKDASDGHRVAVAKQRLDTERPGGQAPTKPRTANLDLPSTRSHPKASNPASRPGGEARQGVTKTPDGPNRPRTAKDDDDRPGAKGRPIDSGKGGANPRPNTAPNTGNQPPRPNVSRPPASRPAPPPPRKNEDRKKGR